MKPKDPVVASQIIRLPGGDPGGSDKPAFDRVWTLKNKQILKTLKDNRSKNKALTMLAMFIKFIKFNYHHYSLHFICNKMKKFTWVTIHDSGAY